MPRRAFVRLALVALVALVLAPSPCDAQGIRRASPEPEIPSDRRPGSVRGVDRPSRPSKGKPSMTSKLGEVCTASEPEMCYTDDECAVQHPCTRTECSTKSIHLRTITGLKGRGAKGPEQGVCVCFGDHKDDDTLCISETNAGVCKSPLGTCQVGACVATDTDDGCPCGDSCVFDAENECVNKDVPCVCGNGSCETNYLPVNSLCAGTTEQCFTSQCALGEGNVVECVGTSVSGTPCTAADGGFDSLSVDFCKGPVGTCDNGACDLADKEDGCPCGGDTEQCLTDLTDEQMACVYPSQMCKCGSGDDAGKCVPNFLPEDTVCESKEILGACGVAVCSSDGVCTDRAAPLNTPCYAGDVDCPDAGVCDTDGQCQPLQCQNPGGQECSGKSPGDECLKDDVAGTCCPFGIGSGLVCNVEVLPPGQGTCPCFQLGTCVYEGDNDGYCCLKPGDVFECKENVEACDATQPSFCELLAGPNAACNVFGRGCGNGPGGQNECDEMCKLVNPDAACANGDGKCNCRGIGPGSDQTCAGPQTKCCFCETPES